MLISFAKWLANWGNSRPYWYIKLSMVNSSASQLAPLAIFIATYTLVLVNLITSWLVWAEIKCTVNFALPINQFTPDQKSRHQVLKAYCPSIYTLSLLIRWEKRQYLFGEEVNPDHIFLALLIGIRLLNIIFRIRLKLISIQPNWALKKTCVSWNSIAWSR